MLSIAWDYHATTDIRTVDSHIRNLREKLKKACFPIEQFLKTVWGYLRIVGIPSVLISLMLIFGSILRANGDTKTPMKVSWWINILHIGLDYVLILGIGSWSGWGIEGAAWATVIVRVLGTGALYYHIRKSTISFSLFNRERSVPLYLDILRISFPTAIERLMMRLGQVLYFGLIVSIGTKTFAAHTMPGYGMGIAATTLVGMHVGARRYREAYQYGILATVSAIIFMSLVGVFMFVSAPLLAGLFTADTEAIRMVTIALRIDAFAQPALAVGLVLAGALQGAGDTKSPMYSTAAGMWLIRIAGIYVLGIYLEMGIAGVWLAITIDLFARAVFLYWRYRFMFKRLGTSGEI